jgi:hypothetical protein
MITETDEVTAALAAARKRWPLDTPTQLLQRLIAHGHACLQSSTAEHQAAIAAASGAGTGMYGPSYLAELHQDWDRDGETGTAR